MNKIWMILFGFLLTAVADGALETSFKKTLEKQQERALAYERDLGVSVPSVLTEGEMARLHQEMATHQGPSDDRLQEVKTLLDPNGSCQKKCSGAFSGPESPTLHVAMSFSVPDTVWIGLNADLIQHQGVFVMKGLPENSFQAFSAKVMSLRKQGVTAPIHIDPKVFETFSIQQVPYVIVKSGQDVHRIAGTVSLTYVMGLIRAQEGKRP